MRWLVQTEIHAIGGTNGRYKSSEFELSVTILAGVSKRTKKSKYILADLFFAGSTFLYGIEVYLSTRDDWLYKQQGCHWLSQQQAYPNL